MREFTIRPATPDDIPVMWEIDQVCFDPDIAYSVDIFYFYLLMRKDPAFVVEDEAGKIFGFVLTSRDMRKTATLVTIDILPGWRRCGVGSKLIRIAEDAMASQGARRMILQTSMGNAAAISFYEQQGYKEVKILRNYYGNGKDALQFEKKLET